jgi:hypothetical protein
MSAVFAAGGAIRARIPCLSGGDRSQNFRGANKKSRFFTIIGKSLSRYLSPKPFTPDGFETSRFGTERVTS